MRTNPQLAALLQNKHSIIGFTKFASTFDNCFENWPDIGGRRGNHSQDVSASGLVGERLGEVTGFCLHLPKQADILDRDQSLICKRADKLDLAIRESAGLRFRERKHTFDLALPD